MNLNVSSYFVLVALAVSFAGCPGGKKSETKPANGKIVAKVGDVEITLDEFERHINQQNRLVRTRYKSLEQKKKLLESLVEREAMVLEAKRLGLDKDPEVVRGLKKILARHLVNQEFNQKRAKEIKISEEEIKKYYEENHDRYHAPEKVRIHKIFFRGQRADQKSRDAAREKARKILAQLKAKPEDRRLFIQLAREHSEDEATKRIGGDTNFKTLEQLTEIEGKAVADAAFALKQTNEISDVIEDDKGFYILRQSGKQPPIDLPLEKVKEQIRTTLFARVRGETYKDFVKEMKSRAGVKVFADVAEKAKVDLSDVPVPPHQAKPSGFPSGKGSFGNDPHATKKIHPKIKQLKVPAQKNKKGEEPGHKPAP